MEYPRAYKWNIIEYPLKYDIIFHLGLPQEYAYSYSPRRVGTQPLFSFLFRFFRRTFISFLNRVGVNTFAPERYRLQPRPKSLSLAQPPSTSTA